MDAERDAWEVLNSNTWCRYVCSADYAECGCRQTIAAALRQARAEAIEECARVAASTPQAHARCGHEPGYMDGRYDAEAGHGPEPTIEPLERRPAIFRLKVTETPPPLPIDEAERGLMDAIPEGYVLVPIDPTEAMVEAGRKAMEQGDPVRVSHARVLWVWMDMIECARAAQAERG